MNFGWLLIFSFFSSVSSQNNTGVESILSFLKEEERLLSFLLQNYRKDIPPIYTRDRFTNVSKPITMSMIITSCKLLSMNEAQQTVNVLVEWTGIWIDYRLQWNPDDFGGLKLVTIVGNLLWLPDTMPIDLTAMQELISSQMQNIIVYPNGTCVILVSATMSQLCRLNIEYFPFDKQHCDMQLRSSNYISTEMELFGSIVPSLIPETTGNGAWTVENLSEKNEIIQSSVDGYNYAQVTFTISMKRSSTYYVILIIIPSIIITSLTVLGMFWSEICEQSYMEKVTLGFSSFLAQTVILQIATQSIPVTSNLPVLAIYILLNLCILFLSVVAVLITSSYFNCEVSQKRQEALLLSTCRFHRILGRMWKKLHFFYSWLFMIMVIANFLICVLRGP